MSVEIIVHPDADSLASAVAARLITSIIDAQAARGRASVVLTGGGMAGQTQEAVVASPAARAVDWSRVDFFWGDERFLPAGHPDRNETQAREKLLTPLSIDESQIHAMPASDGQWGSDVAAAAIGHAEHLAGLRSTQRDPEGPQFDVLMLGVGADAHVASLFPGHPQTRITDVTVTSIVDSPKPPPMRLTFTFPVLQSAQEVWLVTAGGKKAQGLAKALHPNADQVAFPAAGAIGIVRTLALIDHDAAEYLPQPAVRDS